MDSTASSAKAGEPLPKAPWWLRGLCRLPLPLLYAICAGLVFIVRYVLRYRVQVARENLRACFPDWPEARLRRVLNKHYQYQGQVLAESLKLGSWAATELAGRMELSGFEPIREQLRAGQPVLMLTAHLGNWEWSLQAAVLQVGGPIFAAYKPPRSAAADRAVCWLRGRLGVHMVAGKRLLRTLARQRGRAHLTAMVADQAPTSSGGRVWLTFLGRETAFFPGPAEIARVCKYVSYFAGVQRIGRGRYRTRVALIARPSEVLDTAQFTARYAAQLEIEIRAAPASWAWTHRRWKLTRGADEPLLQTNPSSDQIRT